MLRRKKTSINLEPLMENVNSAVNAIIEGAKASEPPPQEPLTGTFTHRGETIDLAQYTEFRFWQDHERGKVWAKFVGANGERTLSLSSVEEARQIERAVNPFWGRL